MKISEVPGEVLSLILGQLLEYQQEDDPESAISYEHLRNARLVCHRWKDLATAHLFRTLTLDGNPEHDTGPWKEIIDSEMIQHAVREIAIYSHPELDMDDDVSDVSDDVTEADEDNDSENFLTAVRGIAKLPNLKSLQICFPSGCVGIGDKDWYGDDEEFESASHRLQVLKTVFQVIQDRQAAIDEKGDRTSSSIRSMTLKNLQNIPIPEFTSSDLYKDVMKHIDELHLLVTNEYHEHGPDHDLDVIERQTYEPYLQKELLPPLTHQLRSLTLTFKENWGVIPAYFDGKGLDFPNLKTLTLGEFTIGHHNQFDWVLAQKSLETLRLDRCFIVSYLRVSDEQWDQWRVPSHDWHKYPQSSFGFYDDDRVFGFPGTWETVYDRIREELPKLREFCSVYHSWSNTFDRREDMGASMGNIRYIVFDSGLCPSPWIQAKDYNGDMHFGNNDPAVMAPDAPAQERYTPRKPLSRAKETEVGDKRAFEELLRAVRERR